MYVWGLANPSLPLQNNPPHVNSYLWLHENVPFFLLDGAHSTHPHLLNIDIPCVKASSYSLGIQASQWAAVIELQILDSPSCALCSLFHSSL